MGGQDDPGTEGESAVTARHYWMTQGMARATGVNLCAAISAGRLTRERLDDMVAACALCGRSADCLAWLGRNAGSAGGPPSYCALRPVLGALAAGQRPRG